jgi:cobyrinic acid a,c-diamide synthase
MATGDHSVHNVQPFGCLLISSPQGHSGKTIVSIGLCKAFRRKGFSVQPFKKGPDYIDPSWLTVATGRSCRNLDLFLIPKESLIHSFRQASQGVDLAIIEGAMGLYDGLDSLGYGTSAEIARLLNVPILLTVNATRMTDSIAAMVMGYQSFQPGTHIAGIILNQVAGNRHERKLRNAVEKYCKIPVVGSIPRDPEFHIPERHLGLIPPGEGESEKTDLVVEHIGRKMEAFLDLDHILTIARSFKAPHPSPLPTGEKGNKGIKAKISVIRDRAFNFYYPENLEALSEAGAELIFINSLKDRLPDIDGLYIGGGFPEFFLEELEGNHGLRQDIAKAAEDGLPVYAECAGLMYLCRDIHWRNRRYEMVGLIPGEIEMCQRPQGHGYVLAEVTMENPLFPEGLTIRGHEFHHSRLHKLNGIKFAYQISRGHGIDGKRDGIVYKNVFASYTHLHALGTPEWAEAFVALALRRKNDQPSLSALKN